MSKQEDFPRPEKPLEKTREIDNEVRISKNAEMKRKFNRNQKRITLWDIQLSSLTSLVKPVGGTILKDLVDHILPSILWTLFINLPDLLIEMYLRPSKISTMWSFLLKRSIKHVWQDLKYISDWFWNEWPYINHSHKK